MRNFQYWRSLTENPDRVQQWTLEKMWLSFGWSVLSILKVCLSSICILESRYWQIQICSLISVRKKIYSMHLSTSKMQNKRPCFCHALIGRLLSLWSRCLDFFKFWEIFIFLFFHNDVYLFRLAWVALDIPFSSFSVNQNRLEGGETSSVDWSTWPTIGLSPLTPSVPMTINTWSDIKKYRSIKILTSRMLIDTQVIMWWIFMSGQHLRSWLGLNR